MSVPAVHVKPVAHGRLSCTQPQYIRGDHEEQWQRAHDDADHPNGFDRVPIVLRADVSTPPGGNVVLLQSQRLDEQLQLLLLLLRLRQRVDEMALFSRPVTKWHDIRGK